MVNRLTTGYNLARYESLPDTSDPGWETDPRNTPLVIERVLPGGQRLTVIGVDHFTDPGNSHHLAVIAALERFEEVTRTIPRIVLVEGDIRTIEPSADEAYRRGSESSLLAFLADQEGIAQDCIEPPHVGIEWLLGRKSQLESGEEVTLGKEDYIGWLTAMWGPVCLRRKTDYDTYAVPRIQKELLKLGWTDIDTSPMGLREMYKRCCSKDFDPQNKQLLLRQSLGVPRPPQDRIEAFARERYILRHHHLALGFDYLLREGVSICATLGTPNVIILEPWLKSLGIAESIDTNDRTFSY